MSDDLDDEEPSVLQYHRISATAVDAVLVTMPADFPPGTDKMWHVQSLLTIHHPALTGSGSPLLSHSLPSGAWTLNFGAPINKGTAMRATWIKTD